MSEAYSRRLRMLALEAARRIGIRLAAGVYLANLGPTYETPAEIRMMRLGAPTRWG
jgi:purine-nucleoside phosphorylase